MNWTSELMIQENLRKRDLRVEENFNFRFYFFKSATDSFPYYFWIVLLIFSLVKFNKKQMIESLIDRRIS
jgi:hypothetical protein